MKFLDQYRHLDNIVGEFTAWLQAAGRAPSTVAVYARAVGRHLVALERNAIPLTEVWTRMPPESQVAIQAWQAFERFRGSTSPSSSSNQEPPRATPTLPHSVAWAGYVIADWVENPGRRPEYRLIRTSKSLDARVARWQSTGWPGKRLAETRWSEFSWEHAKPPKLIAEALGIPEGVSAPALYWRPIEDGYDCKVDWAGTLTAPLSILQRWGQWPQEWWNDRWLLTQLPLFPLHPRSTVPMDPRAIENAIKFSGPYSRTPPPDDF